MFDQLQMMRNGSTGYLLTIPYFLRPGNYNMDMHPNLQEDCEESVDNEENFVAIRNTSNGTQFSGSVILRDG